MSKVRKPCNRRAQIDRSRRALVRTNHAAVVDVQPPDRQVMLNWKNYRQITSLPVANALCDLAHRWTIYMSVFCQQPDGSQYSKSTEFSPVGVHLVANLEQLMIEKHAELVAASNPNHMIGSGWLAIPDDVTLTEVEANRVFTAMGVWRQRAQAA